MLSAVIFPPCDEKFLNVSFKFYVYEKKGDEIPYAIGVLEK